MSHATTSGYDWIWLPTRLALYQRDHWRCVACHKPGHLRGGLSLDHVIPGRDNRACNLVTLCLSCNSSKGQRSFREWQPGLIPVVRNACRRVLDRAAGRRMADEMKPGWRASKRLKDARRNASRRAGTYDLGSFDPRTLEA